MIIAKLPRCHVVLLESELEAMLKQNPDIWAQGVKRGKHYCRTEKAHDRVTSKPVERMKRL